MTLSYPFITAGYILINVFFSQMATGSPITPTRHGNTGTTRGGRDNPAFLGDRHGTDAGQARDRRGTGVGQARDRNGTDSNLPSRAPFPPPGSDGHAAIVIANHSYNSASTVSSGPSVCPSVLSVGNASVGSDTDPPAPGEGSPSAYRNHPPSASPPQGEVCSGKYTFFVYFCCCWLGF